MFNRRGKPGEDKFLRKPAADPDTPTVEPLRISKRESVSPQSTGSTTSHQDGAAPLGKSQPWTGPDRPRNGSPAGRLHCEGQQQTSNGSSRPGFDPDGSNGVDSGQGGADRQRNATLAERRGNVSMQFDGLQGRSNPDSDGLFAKRPQRPGQGQSSSATDPVQQTINPYPDYHQQYWPQPAGGAGASGAISRLDSTASASTTVAQRGSPPPTPGQFARPAAAELAAPKPSVNRLNSTASTSTTKAERGSPPPPETPISPAGGLPGGDIEARYAAAGIAGAATLNNLHARNAAAAQRANQYAHAAPRQQSPPRRPWTPTEQPGSQPYGPPTVYQGPAEVVGSSPPRSTTQRPAGLPAGQGTPTQNGLEEDLQGMHLSSSPPPAYSSVPQVASASQSYPIEKAGAASQASAAGAAPAAQAVPQSQPHNAGHPAFANDHLQTPSTQPAQEPQPQMPQKMGPQPEQPGMGPASLPPLPEGWMAHLDQTSGQYYYIHLPTQSTQWEFPKGPTPLNLAEPLSPTLSTYHGQPLASPGLSSFGIKPLASAGLASPGMPPLTPGYSESVAGMGLASPGLSVFTGPPPQSGVDMYNVAPTNGVYFGPYLRYANMDLERGIWLGSVLLVTDAPQPPTIHIHQSVDLSPNPRQLKANAIHTHQRWVFYRYDIDLQMEEEGSAKWTYAITSHLGCTRYEFLVAGRHETSWRFIAHSGNDFSMGINSNERNRLGGVGFMWKDVMQKNLECGGFHVQLGLGDQIYADRLWREIPLLKQWLEMRGKDNRKNAPWTAKHEEDVSHAYFHYYTSHFDQPHLREAFAQIPHILQIDDHDIFDGFGSYPEYMQFSHMFKNIGRIAIEKYLLFQHHTTPEMLRNVSNDQDIFTVTGTGWHFIKYLGPAVVVVGPDTRSERNPHQVIAGPTYQGLFPRIANLPPTVQHCLWMVAVPLIYPRLEAAESIANTIATSKKAVTSAYNVLGRMTSSVAGVVGAKGFVGEGFNTVKKAVGKSGLMGGILSPFGDVDMLDEFRDQWAHESKDLERTYLIRTLQEIAHRRSIRMTFLSGDVNCCGAGLVHDPAHPSDHKTMYQIISSSIVSAPLPSYVIKLLHNNKVLYVPQNGTRSNHAPSDTKEDMMEIFQMDVNGAPRESKKLMGRRNYVACVAYDPDLLSGAASMTGAGYPAQGKGALSLAVDFIVQGDGLYNPPVKYGPVVIPHVEFGR